MPTELRFGAIKRSVGLLLAGFGGVCNKAGRLCEGMLRLGYQGRSLSFATLLEGKKGHPFLLKSLFRRTII
jgi:hypothetical protein